MTWAVDANSPNDNQNYINAGMEIGFFNDLIIFRGGINSIFLDNKQNQFSYGIGVQPPMIKNKSLQINYAFEMLKHLGDTHQVSMEISY